MVRRAVGVPLRTVLREWGRLGLIGFGGPPAHVALLRDLVVERRRWLEAREFEDANAACQLLPGPASTQLAIYCALRTAGLAGAILGGLAFIAPGLLMVLAIAAVALGDEPPDWILGIGAGAGAAVVAVVVAAGITLGRASLAGRRDARAPAYVAAGAVATVLAGPYVVVVLLATGLLELAWRPRAWRRGARVARRARVRRRPARACLDRLQGRRAVVRRRLRDHPAHAGGRRRAARLDDRLPVPRRGRVRPDDAGAGDAHGRARRLGGGGPRRRAARGRDRVRAVVPRDRARRRALRARCARTAPRARSSTAPARRQWARSSGAAMPLAGALGEWWQAAVLAAAAALLAFGRPPIWALAGGALCGLAVALGGGPLP